MVRDPTNSKVLNERRQNEKLEPDMRIFQQIFVGGCAVLSPPWIGAAVQIAGTEWERGRLCGQCKFTFT